MTSDQLAAVIFAVSGLGFGGAIGGGIVGFLAKNYLPAYLGEKGKGLATKEDIEEITDKVESVRAQYTDLAEGLKARHQLRLAAVERRLQAHQEAFTHWRRLLGATYGSDVNAVTRQCQEWWEQNCVFLEPKVRGAFVMAYTAAHSHADLLAAKSDSSVLQSNWQNIMQFPEVLFSAVELPGLSELERKILEASAHRAG